MHYAVVDNGEAYYVSINSTSYKRSDFLTMLNSCKKRVYQGKFPLIPLLIKEAMKIQATPE